MLPAAATSNVGIYGSGQAYEALLVRLRAHPLPEARSYGDLMLAELRKVIPSWVKRVDVADRGGAWSAYLEKNHDTMRDLSDALFGPAGRGEAGDGGGTPVQPAAGGEPEVTLVDWDPGAEAKLITAMLYPYTSLPEQSIAARVEAMSSAERIEVVRAYAGERVNRRQRPGRALERVGYRFDVLSDYGAFRDLQRHRMLTIEWQDLTPYHGFTRPRAVEVAGGAELYDATMDRSARLFEDLAERFGPARAAYAVSLAYRVRYSLQLNAREAMHLIELRTGPQGHPEYRKVGQQMHRLIAEKAGHRAVAELMSFVDHEDYGDAGLERLDGERRAAARRARA
jgi:hypothetical protein